MKIYISILLVFISLSLYNCKNNEDKADYSNNRKVLSKLVNLEAYTPLKVKWRTVSLTKESFSPGPSDFKLEAELTFKKSEIDTLKEKYRLLSVTFPNVELEEFEFPWLTKKQRRMLKQYQGTSYQSNFFDKIGYQNGTFVILDDQTILLIMQTH